MFYKLVVAFEVVDENYGRDQMKAVTCKEYIVMVLFVLSFVVSEFDVLIG